MKIILAAKKKLFWMTDEKSTEHLICEFNSHLAACFIKILTT